MVDSLAHNEGMPPLYFAGLWFWRRGLGESEFALRIFSIVQGVLGVALMAALGRKLFRQEIGLLGAAIVAVSPMHITLSQWIRPYALVLWITVCLLLLALRLGQHPTRRDWILFWIAAIVAMYTLYILGVLLLGIGLYVWYRRCHLGLRKSLSPVTAIGLGTLAAFAPWLPVVWHQDTWAPKALWWVSPPQPRVILETLDLFLLGGESRGWPQPVILVLIPALVVLLALGMYRAWKTGRLSFILLTTGVPLLLVWIVSYWSPMYLPRHVVFALPAIVLLVIEALLGFRPVLRSAIIVALLGAGVAAQITPPVDQGDMIAWSRVAAWMASHAQPGDLVVFSPPFQQTPFEIKYTGPSLETRGIGEYEAYVRQPDAVLGVYIPLDTVKRWVKDKSSFWLLEDTRWPVNWGDWEYQGSLQAEFPGLRIYLFKRQIALDLKNQEQTLSPYSSFSILDFDCTKNR